MPTSWAFASSVCSALLLAGCGGGASLVASDLAPGGGLHDVPDRRTNSSIDPVPTWQADGGELSFSLLVRNTGDETVRVVGVARDENGDDQQFVPTGIAEPVTLEPNTARRVEIRGRTDCNGRMSGQISRKNGQRFRLEGGGTADAGFEALLEFVCR